MNGHEFLKLMLLLVLLGAAGLAVFLHQDEAGIRRYTVQRPEPPDRTLGAIIPRGEQAWFFKLSGPNGAVAQQAEAFRTFVSSVRFGQEADAPPSWKLPAGWKQLPGSQMRFATLEIDNGDQPLECSVSMLPMTSSDLSSYVMANINRWRDQLRLPKLAMDQLDRATTKISLEDSSLTATLVDFAGTLSSGRTGAAPFAGGPMGGGAPRTESGLPDATEKLTYDIPQGWVPGELEVSRSGVTVRRAAVFEVRDGRQRAEITVTKLPASAILTNVNRWRGQIGLEGISAEKYEQDKKQIEFAGGPADYVQFLGTQDAILGVIAHRGAVAWFVKLQGPPELAGRERENFEQFVRSIRL